LLAGFEEGHMRFRVGLNLVLKYYVRRLTRRAEAFAAAVGSLLLGRR
jgi:hypothetical protein